MSRRHIRRVITFHLEEHYRKTKLHNTSNDSITHNSCHMDDEFKESSNTKTISRAFPLFKSDLSLSSNIKCNFSPANVKFRTPNEKFSVKLSQWGSKHNISRSTFNELLLLLQNEGIALPKDSRSFTRVHHNLSVQPMGSGSYVHFGLISGIKHVLHKQTLNSCYLKLDINSDGLPLTKSSNSQFWVILGSVEVDSNRISKPFIIGVFHGESKPNNPEIFLRQFVNEYLSIQQNGIIINDKTVFISLDKIICDAPAKAFILGIKSHNSYFGCTKCLVEGDYVNNRMCYLSNNSPLRTNIDFRNGQYEDHDYYKTPTPLTEINFDIIAQVPLDYMHLVCLGVMKRLLQFWVKGNKVVRLSADGIERVSVMLSEFRNVIPPEFSRLPRSLQYIDRWKATELRQFLLYSGPVILKNVLPKHMYDHFVALHCGIRILVSADLCKNYNLLAKQCIMYFIEKFGEIYGHEFINHNVHNLGHLNEDVLKYGDLDRFSSFKYENVNYKIKVKLKTSRFPLQQLINKVQIMKEYEDIDEIKYPRLLNKIAMENNKCLLP